MFSKWTQPKLNDPRFRQSQLFYQALTSLPLDIKTVVLSLELDPETPDNERYVQQLVELGLDVNGYLVDFFPVLVPRDTPRGNLEGYTHGSAIRERIFSLGKISTIEVHHGWYDAKTGYSGRLQIQLTKLYLMSCPNIYHFFPRQVLSIRPDQNLPPYLNKRDAEHVRMFYEVLTAEKSI